MTEAKQTPKQIVTARIEGATSRKRGGLYEIVDYDFRIIGTPTTTAAAAWKQAAEHLAYLDAKQRQAEEFSAAASKPTPQAPVVVHIPHKVKLKRRAKAKQARQSRKLNRRRAA